MATRVFVPSRSLEDHIDGEGGKHRLRERGSPLARRIEDVPNEAAGVTHFRCRCGRLVTAEMLRDLRNPEVPESQQLSVSERSHLQLGEDRFRCDACYTSWIWRGLASKERLREATGQPPPEPEHRW